VVSVELLRSAFASDEQEAAIDLKNRVDRPQTALTHQRQARRCVQMKPGLWSATAYRTAFATHAPMRIALGRHVGMRRTEETLENSQRPVALQLGTILGKGFDVEAARVSGTAFHGASVRASIPDTHLASMGQCAPMNTRPPLILASTSRYRRELLERLRLPFQVRSPDVDENPLPGEATSALVERLAMAKALAIAQHEATAVVIGSDQAAELDGQAISKPGSHERAVQQLRMMSGRSVVFHTAVTVVRENTGFRRCTRVPVTVRFRRLGDEDIERYLRLEQPYDCAGSAKCETLGIALLDAIESNDPTALVGLPLIETCRLLREAGLDPLSA
jgi:septum formation protein